MAHWDVLLRARAIENQAYSDLLADYSIFSRLSLHTYFCFFGVLLPLFFDVCLIFFRHPMRRKRFSPHALFHFGR